jgi:hypothetical protein
MPNPNYTHTITLFHKKLVDKKEIWTSSVISNCFYKCETTISQNGTDVSKSNTYTARIPQGDIDVSMDDIVVYGSVIDEIGKDMNATQLLHKYKPDAFRITSISDNTRYKFGKHIRLGG